MQLQPFIGRLFDIYFYKAGIFFQTKRSLIVFFSISRHMTSKELLPTASFRARNAAKSVALIFSGNMQVCCFPREQSRSVQNSPLSIYLLPKVSLQQHYSICLLSLVSRVFLLPVPKSAQEMGNGQEEERERERKIKGNVLSTFHDWHHNFVLDITWTSTSFF